MGFIDETDKFLQWRYEVSEFIILYSGTTYEVPKERMTAISISHDYEKNLYPKFKWEFVLEPSVYFEMMKEKSNVKFKIRIQKYYKERGKEEKSLYRDYINATFAMIVPDDPNDVEASLKRDAEIESDKNELRKVDNRIELFLYKDETVFAMKTTINTVLTTASMSGAVGYIISQSGLSGKILMSPMENTTMYNELVLPPLNALKSIQSLDTNYGFYKKGALVYFGFDYGYILNYAGGCTAYVKDELQDVCILVPEKSNSASADSGMVQKENQKTRMYIITQPNQVNVQNKSISNDVINGNNATVINSETSEISTIDSGAISKGSGNMKMIENNTNNKFMGEIYAAQAAANSVVITVSLGDIDLEAIRPNKKFVFIFEDSSLGQKYKGVYMIASAEIKFVKDGADFSAESVLTFKRVGDDPVISQTYLT